MEDHSKSGHNDIKKIISDVFQSTWLDFSQYDFEDSQRSLRSLSRTYNAPSNRLTRIPSETVLKTAALPDDPLPESSSQINEFDFYDVPISVPLHHKAQFIKQYPAYECCTSTSRSVMVGDDPNYMPFLPFADDPTFNHQDAMEEYKFFSWQRPNQDPNLEVIAVEAARRLTRLHHISLEDIIKTGLLPLTSDPLLLLTSSRRRDYPPWPGGPTRGQALPYLPSYLAAGPSTKLNDILSNFCNHPSCMTGYCTIHLESIPLPIHEVPTVTSDALMLAPDKPCSKICFIVGSKPSLETFWNDADIEILHSTLKFSPDSSPCDLSIICRKPCQEVFKRREKYFRNLPVKSVEKTTKGKLPKKITGPTFSDHDALNFTPYDLLSHCLSHLINDQIETAHAPMRVLAMLNLLVHVSKIEPTASPLVDVTKNAYEGILAVSVPSQKKVKHAGLHDVPVSWLIASVTPINVSIVRQDATANICKNSVIQQGFVKTTAVRQSKFGLGLFVTEDVEEDDLISEYIGELIFEPTTKSRDGVAKHRERTYLFQLNQTISVDSTFIGNEARYINHDSNLANCHANVRLVNGEHRIGLFASKRIARSSEILFDYGPEFFVRDQGQLSDEVDPSFHLTQGRSSDLED